MRVAGIVAIIAISIAIPVVSAHGADSYSIIMRNTSIQPNQAEILQNDSLVFHNVVDANRTIRVDYDGDGEYDLRCETESSSTSSIRNKCDFWIDPVSWKAGEYEFVIFSNGTLWKTLNVTITDDEHADNGPPEGYQFNNENNGTGIHQSGSGNIWESMAVLLGIVSFILLMRWNNEN